MIDSLEKRIANKNLTKTEIVIADFFFHNKNRLYFLTSTDIAQELNISDTSVIRFVKSLGFNNFKEFKDSLKQQVSDKILTPSEKLILNEEILKNHNLMENFLECINKNIQETLNINTSKKIQKCIDILLNSKKKFVVGFKSTSGPTAFFGLRLGFILKDVITHRDNNSELIKNIIDIQENDCLFLIAHPKYSKTYNLLIELAKNANAKIIVITDKSTSPVANLGDITLFTDVRGISYFNSIISTQTLLEFLLTSLSRNIDDDGKARLASINELLNENK
ncbi:MurR/RpiR family transcriptional regulator [Cetobacterium sp. 8H]|uniref:MurR/RpiR family transcriptional regulator n=1 Tax=Cetobacterium sp. 8H TaxID=2759681 RepID=UPI00163C00CA|nr:MurR/RpiR family transcriptional regulator [Cetobacterium sp. 8H]MBC2850472.1 MurR/RpiR family transcriptional regulator [Cetobacterium sp. 8H]